MQLLARAMIRVGDQQQGKQMCTFRLKNISQPNIMHFICMLWKHSSLKGETTHMMGYSGTCNAQPIKNLAPMQISNEVGIFLFSIFLDTKEKTRRVTYSHVLLMGLASHRNV